MYGTDGRAAVFLWWAMRLGVISFLHVLRARWWALCIVRVAVCVKVFFILPVALDFYTVAAAVTKWADRHRRNDWPKSTIYFVLPWKYNTYYIIGRQYRQGPERSASPAFAIKNHWPVKPHCLLCTVLRFGCDVFVCAVIYTMSIMRTKQMAVLKLETVSFIQN